MARTESILPEGESDHHAGAVLLRATARLNTLSSIGSVSRPVKVFCWLGW